MSSLMKKEIEQIPLVIKKQLEEGFGKYAETGRVLGSRKGPLVTNARGTSDHAAAYFKALVETRLGRVVSSLPPSVSSVYGSDLQLEDGAMLSVSQSGGSPDLIKSQKSAKKGGAITVALSNHPGSALAQGADLSVDMFAGEENAIAATKTFVASLFACHSMVRGMLGLDDADFASPLLSALQTRPNQKFQTRFEESIKTDSVFTISRGLGLPVALEAALKLKEICQIHAEAYSAAEVIHGPMVLARQGITVIAFETGDLGQKSIENALGQMEANGAKIVRIPAYGGDLDSGLAPVAQIAHFYSMIEKLSIDLGFDPDAPPMLKKATETV
jgi:glucosamine--fructose-6-phosphate aminotransferase (isomerizing)